MFSLHIRHTLCLLLLSLCANAQLVPVTHFTGSATVGTRTITVTTSGSATTYYNACLGMPQQYHSAPSGAGKYIFTVSGGPVYSIRIEGHGLNAGPMGGGEYMDMEINGAPYSLLPADVVSYSNCGSTGAGPCYLYSGRLYGPYDVSLSFTHHNAGIVQVNKCTGITSFSVGSNGITGGIAYHLYIDTMASTICQLTATNNGPLCMGDTLKLFATPSTPGGTFNWTGPAGFSSLVQNPIIVGATPANSGTYTVVQTVGSSTFVATTTVTVNAAPVITAGSNSPVCEGDTLLLTASPPTSGLTFSWTGPMGFSSALQNPMLYPVTTANGGIYTVIAALGGCRDTASTDVTITPPLTLTVTNNGPVCAGRALTLTVSPVSPGETFNWVGPAGFSSSSASPVIAFATVWNSGTYSLTATLGSCSNTAYTDVSILPVPDITITNNSPLCVGDTLILTASTAVSGIPSCIFSWTGPGGYYSVSPSISRSGVTIGMSGIYTVIADASPCYDTATTTVIVDPVPSLTATSSGLLCEGQDLLLTAGPAEPGKTFLWTGPGSFSSTLQNPTVAAAAATASGQYTVLATLGGCSSQMQVGATVIDLPPALKDTVVCTDLPINIVLREQIPEGSTIRWNTGDRTSVLSVTDTGQYWMVITTPACTIRDTVNITGELCDCDLVIPSAFTPNADGLNDRYGPILQPGCVIKKYHFAIYNRWGQEVFTSNDPMAKWDGKIRGQEADLGVFMYYLKYTAGRNEERMRKGDVTLIR